MLAVVQSNDSYARSSAFSLDVNALVDTYDVDVDAIASQVHALVTEIDLLERELLTFPPDESGTPRHVELTTLTAKLKQTADSAQKIRLELRRLANQNDHFAIQNPDKKAALRMRINAHQAATRSFMEAMDRLDKAQGVQRTGMKRALEWKLRELNPQASEAEIERAVAEGSASELVSDSPMLMELPPAERKRILAQVDTLKERNEDIRKLEANIVELHQIFMDMQLIVQNQGDLLNAAEYNIVETKVATEAAVQELVQTRDYQKAARRKKCCVVMVVIVILLSVVVPILAVYIPKWFPQTADAINAIPIIGNGTETSPSPIALPPVNASEALWIGRGESEAEGVGKIDWL